MSSLRELSKELGRVVARALPSVVTIQSGRCESSTGLVWGGDRVVTAASCLRREEGLEVLVGNERRPGALVGFDPASDLAVLRVDGALPPPLGRAEPPALGELVLALGRDPSPLVRLGAVSRLGGEWRLAGGGRFERYVESDVGSVAGLSGGPLIDVNGDLIGLNSGSVARGRLVTLPGEGVDRIVAAIGEHGRVRRARLGVSVQRVELPPKIASEIKRTSGLIVLGVQPGSSADAAGIELGDVLVALGGATLGRVEELQAALDTEAIDRPVTVEFIRAGKFNQAKIVPTANN